MDVIGHSDATLDLSEARVAYETALSRLEQALPQARETPIVVDPSAVSWQQALLRSVRLAPVALLKAAAFFLISIRNEVAEALRDLKTRLVRFVQQQPVEIGGPEVEYRKRIRMLLLEVLWSRDHIQEAIEERNGASYRSRREVLSFVMANENRLQRLGQRALERADLETSELREAQPMLPDSDHWWWFMRYPRARRARRYNTLWFVMALVPALASIILVTLLAQRLAINGPDLLSGASMIAQVGLGLAGIIAGREILGDLILRGATGAWEGKLTFSLATLFLIVIVVFYFLAPPGAAMVYHAFGQRAIDAGNAAEAELYLESAARLVPDPYAASLLEVGCLYQALGSPDRAQDVFERVLEADSRLLLARYHLAEIYSDRGEHDMALQLLEDGLNLLEAGREKMQDGHTGFLPGVDTDTEADQMEYLLRLARGRAYLESNAPEQAKANLRDAEDLFTQLMAYQPPNGASLTTTDRLNLMCGPDDDRAPFIAGTQLNLHYFLARTYDSLCDDDTTIEAALQEWRLVRNGQPASSRQEAWRDDAVRRLSSGKTCSENYDLQSILGLGELPRRP